MPVTAVLSISHRLTGLMLALMIPVSLYFFDLSLQSEEGYKEVLAFFDLIAVKCFLVFIFWCLALHFFAGLRFLIIDFDIGVLKKQARHSAWFVYGLSTLSVLILIGAWL